MTEPMPLKLLIVEDESNIRNLIKLSVNWEAIGMRIAGEASTGLEALQLIEELLPDIVLTDIEMPHMDGLALSQRISERHSDVVVIVLTAHDHFKYAQRALRANVTNYLLKPVDKAKLEQALSAAARQIRDRRSMLTKTENFLMYVQKNWRFFQDRALEELICSGRESGLEDVFEVVGVRLGQGSQYALALMDIVGNGTAHFNAQKYCILENCRSYIEENYARDGHMHVFFDRTDKLILLSHRAAETDLSDICRQIAEAIGESQPYRVCYGVSDNCRDLSQLPAAYAQAKDAQQLALLSAKNNEGTSQDAGSMGDRRDLGEQMPDMMLLIKSGLCDKAVRLGVYLMRRTASLQNGDINAAKMLAINILTSAVNTLADLGIPWQTLMALVYPGFEQFLNIASISALEELLSGQVASLSELAGKYQRQRSDAVVFKIIRDLEDNYHDSELSLSSIAAKYACNYSYLSRVFKACTGKSFSEYLIDIRMQKAKEILERNDYKAYQLALEVGIPDPGYFAKCFKRAVGMSFQAYKAEKKVSGGRFS